VPRKGWKYCIYAWRRHKEQEGSSMSVKHLWQVEILEAYLMKTDQLRILSVKSRKFLDFKRGLVNYVCQIQNNWCNVLNKKCPSRVCKINHNVKIPGTEFSANQKGVNQAYIWNENTTYFWYLYIHLASFIKAIYNILLCVSVKFTYLYTLVTLTLVWCWWGKKICN
jgi:hypothetical protein